MANKVKQIRYYGKNSDKNSDADLGNELIKGIINSQNGIIKSPIVSLGIQTSLPGLQFYINDSVRPIIVGISGIYELNLSDLNKISSLVFPRVSVEAIDNGSHYLIIDALYEDKGDSMS